MLNSGSDTTPMTKMIENIVKGIVDAPDSVDVREMRGEQTLVIHVSVAKSDIGKVLGKKGSMAEALRTILRAIATKHQVRAILEIES